MTRSGDTSTAASVQYSVSGAAVDGADFGGSLPTNVSVPFSAGVGSVTITINVNGQQRRVDVSRQETLAWTLRYKLGLTGTKLGCDRAECGACTILIDAIPRYSCSVLTHTVRGGRVVTIEGLASGGVLHKVQTAWVENDVPQCGYCQSGMIMAVAALLKENPKPTDQDIDDAITNICRCGTFQQVREAIHAAANA